MKINRLTAFSSSLLLSIASLFVLTPLTQAAADTCTWTGGGSDDNFSTAANWSTCDNGTVPEIGDALLFDNTGATAPITANNDIPNLILTDIDFSGSTAQPFNISGSEDFVVNGGPTSVVNVSNGLATISANIVLNDILTATVTNPSPGVVFSGILSGTGSFVKNGVAPTRLSGANTYQGATTVSAGELIASNSTALGTAAGTSVTSGATLKFDITGDGITIDEPLILDGDGLTSRETLEIARGAGSASEITLSGAVTLNAASVEIGSDRPVVLGGIVSGAGGGITFYDNSTDNSGSLNLTGANTYDGGTTAGDVIIVNNTQTSGPLTVTSTGTLKGTGTVGVLTVQAGGHLAPGLSPGCLIAGNTTLAGNFDVEIGGTTACTEYDQLQVTGAVDVTGATLNLSRWNGFTPVAGQTYTVISNDAADAITGTFSGLAQGGTFTVDGYTFSISYTGGDGNDVVVTVTGVPAVTPVPGTPNTGYKLLAANPFVTLMITTLSAGTLYFFAKRYGFTVPKIK